MQSMLLGGIIFLLSVFLGLLPGCAELSKHHTVNTSPAETRQITEMLGDRVPKCDPAIEAHVVCVRRISEAMQCDIRCEEVK